MTPLRVALAGLLLAIASSAPAEPYAADSVVPPIELPDQHGNLRALDPSLRAVVFCRDMGAGDVVKSAVEKAGPTLFERNRAVYIVDLAGMSAFVRRWFALPGLRRRPYRLLVDADGAKTADFPSVEGRPTLLVLDSLRVASVQHPSDADELIALLEPAAR
ncbi:MAG: hypothetical protein ACHQ6T_00445 [Myxococcota bacterium]